MRTLRLTFLALVFASAGLVSAATLPRESVTWTPAVVVAGSPELFRVTVPGATSVEGEWLGRKVEFFRGRDPNAWVAFAGVDVEAPTVPSICRIIAHTAKGDIDLSQTIEVHVAHYRTGFLKVAPGFVEPSPQAFAQIQEEIKLKDQVFSSSAATPLWTTSFRPPVSAPPTDSFGTRRMFNGKLASIHKGMDFRAATGTPVKAGNSGVVVLAQPLYYEGNCVVIDHGLGLYTLSMHLSRVDVRVGQTVATGDKLGLSGATGRVTGPHLHWAVRWQGAYLDPAKVLQLNLAGIR
jgi:murein DD-endopeptidase MepM/ murein hydrolase activator NlpD